MSYVHMSHFQPKSGHEAEFATFFKNEILPVTFSAKGLVSAEVVAAPDGTISNLEVWESKDAHQALVDDLQGRSEEFKKFEVLVEKFWENPVTVVESFKK